MTDAVQLADHLRRYQDPAADHVARDLARSVRAAVRLWSRAWHPWTGGPATWVFIEDGGALRTAAHRGRLSTNPYADGIHPMSYLVEAVAARRGDHRCVALADGLQRVRVRDLLVPSRERDMQVVAVHRDQGLPFHISLRFDPVGGPRRGVRFAPGVDAVLDEVIGTEAA